MAIMTRLHSREVLLSSDLIIKTEETSKLEQSQLTTSFSQHETLFRPLMRPGYSTQTHCPPYMPTDTTPQQWSWFCGCETPPQFEEAEETSTTACSPLITSETLLKAVTSETKPQMKKHFTLLNGLCAPHPGGRRRE